MPDADAIFENLKLAVPPIAWLPRECWIVGGCLRDVLIGVGPKDVDCAAPRAAAAAAAFAARAGGRIVQLSRHPLETWRVVLNGLDWDFTDIDGGTIEADLGRRDFTIGALALSVQSPHVLLDPFDGVSDVEKRVIRMVSPSNLTEDPVRMIRAVRLSGKFGFEIDDETGSFIASNASLLRRSAPERITTEMDAILTCSDVAAPLQALVSTRLDSEVLPGGLDDEAVRRCAAIFSRDPVTRYAALFIGREERLGPHAEASKWSRERRRDVSLLLDFVNVCGGTADVEDSLPLMVHDHGVRTARRAAELLAAAGQVEMARELANLVRERGAALEGIRPLLDGVQVRELLGMEDGPRLGRILRLLVEAQVRGKVRTRAEAVAFVRQSGVGPE